MQVKELEKEIAEVARETYRFTPFRRGIYCIYCKTYSDYGIVSKYGGEKEERDLFSSTIYLDWAYMLRHKDKGSAGTNLLPTGEIRWFCSIKCLASMIVENQDFLLERTTA